MNEKEKTFIELDEQMTAFSDGARDYFFNTVPLTLTGFLLMVLAVAVFKTNSLEAVASVGKTGLELLVLSCCYGIGKTTNILINAALSRITSERRTQE